MMKSGLIISSHEIKVQANKSILWKDRPKKSILLSVDENLFFLCPIIIIIEKKYAINPSHEVVLFSASKISDPRKGFEIYHKSVCLISDNFPC